MFLRSDVEESRLASRWICVVESRFDWCGVTFRLVLESGWVRSGWIIWLPMTWDWYHNVNHTAINRPSLVARWCGLIKTRTVEKTELRMGCNKRRSSGSRRTSGGLPTGPRALPFFICLLAMSTSSIVMSPIGMSCSMSPSPGKMRLMVNLSEWVVLLFSRFSKWVFQPAKRLAGLLALIFTDALDFLPERLLMVFQTSNGFLLSLATWIFSSCP